MATTWLTGLGVLALSLIIMGWSTRARKVDYRGKRCYITGGSSGLGLALAEDLVRKGANVVIVARDQAKLDAAKTALLAERTTDTQAVEAISADLTTKSTSADAWAKATTAFGGKLPDMVFLCAGFAKPGFLVETSEADMRAGMDGVYWVSAWTAQVAAQSFAKDLQAGRRIVFVSSFLALASFVGYATYAPGKFALRGLGETLRSEMLLYGVQVHLYCPAGISSPHLEVENRTKPDITKKIEEDDTPISPEACVPLLLRGIDKGYFTITNDLVTDLMRVAGRGSTPMNNVVYDMLLGAVALIGMPIWRGMTDNKVQKHAKEHQRYLLQAAKKT